MTQISQIILLQEIDNKLFELNKLLGGLPSKVQELEHQEQNFKESLEQNEIDLKSTTINIEKLETIIASANQKINLLKDKLIDGSISNNREYDAMMETIDFEKNQLSSNESEIILLMEKKESLIKEIEEQKSSLESIIEELNSKKESLNKKMEEVADEKNALDAERDQIILKIDSSTLEQYSKIYAARDGVACAEILDSSCEGCGAFIPPQVLNEALAKEIVFCGSCSRFLYKNEN